MNRQLLVFMLLLSTPFLCGFDLFRSSNSNVEQGNTQLKAGKLKEALSFYSQAAKELPDEPGVFYNLGIAHYQMGQFREAREAMLKATSGGAAALKYKSFYNLGNSLFEQKQYKEAIGAYVRALQLNPRHKASKWNLELALRMLKEEEEKKKKEEQDKKDQEKNKDQQKDKQDKKEQNEKGDQKQQKKEDDKAQKQQDKSKKDQQKKDPQQKQQKDQPKPKPSQQQMNNVLDALDRNDKNLQRKRAKRMMSGGYRRPTKDW